MTTTAEAQKQTLYGVPWPVDQIQVDVVQLKPIQRLVDRWQNMGCELASVSMCTLQTYPADRHRTPGLPVLVLPDRQLVMQEHERRCMMLPNLLVMNRSLRDTPPTDPTSSWMVAPINSSFLYPVAVSLYGLNKQPKCRSDEKAARRTNQSISCSDSRRHGRADKRGIAHAIGPN